MGTPAIYVRLFATAALTIFALPALAICPDASSVPGVVLPANSIARNALQSPVQGDALVISEAEFHRLLYDERVEFSAASKNTLKAALQLSVDGNHPNVTGIAATYDTETASGAAEVQADLLIVAQDANLNETGAVEVGRFFIVAADSDGFVLDGWVGRAPMWLSNGAIGGLASCCDGGASPTCGDVQPGRGPGGFCGPEFSSEDCPSPVFGEEWANVNFTPAPTSFASEWFEAGDDCSPYNLNWRRTTGQYAVPVYALNDELDVGGGYPNFPPTKPIVCNHCRVVDCTEPSFDPGDPFDNPEIPNECGTSGNVPPGCDVVSGDPEHLPSECQPYQGPVLDADDLGICFGGGSPGGLGGQLYSTGAPPEPRACRTPVPDACRYLLDGTQHEPRSVVLTQAA